MSRENIKSKPIVWTISGADCSGGAGIAADIKTAHGLGVELCHLITANTVQNSQQLVSVNAVDIQILNEQVQVLINDKAPSVVKIGLLANEEQVNWLVSVLNNLKSDLPYLQVIYDPVGQASVGGKFSSLSSLALMPLLTLVDLVTPNIAEAQQLTGLITTNVEELAQSLIDLSIKQVVVKGGHSEQLSCIDHCLSTPLSMSYQVESERIKTNYSHGGGCSFATAFTCFLSYGYLLRDALTLTKAFISEGMKVNEARDDHYGAFEQVTWPTHIEHFPKINAEINNKYHSLPVFETLGVTRNGEQALGLYPVVDSVEWLKRLMPLGINIIQLRLKNKSQAELVEQITEAVRISKAYDCRLFINDYWQLAIELGAYGVHIGQEDLLEADLSAIQASGLRLGISTHGCYEFLLAQQLSPSYLAVGAIFPTKTKDMTGQIQGVDNLRHMLGLAKHIPVVAIGGINHQRAERVWQTGVDSIAVVTAITEAENFEQATKDFLTICS